MMIGSSGSVFLDIIMSYANSETEIIFTYNYNLEYIFKKRLYLNNIRNPTINARLKLNGEEWLNDKDNWKEFSKVT